MELRGREDECARLVELLDGARAGRSGVLMLVGEAGIGKTALLAYAIASASASAMRVIRVPGIESEKELPFAGLHQLCTTMLDRLERLPGPQRDALQTTFGLSAGPVPDRFLIGLAVLSLLSEVAEERPVLCVIDDAQWLDRGSAQSLAFVARRLLAEPVVLLFAARERSDVFAGLPELLLHGLPDADARTLLAAVIPGRLDQRIADQIVAETRGNPLGLLELPHGLNAAQLAGGFGLTRALSLPGKIEESFLKRRETLPEETQRLLLLAAAEPTGDPGVLWRAADRLGIDDAALEPAEAAGLVGLSGQVRFRHPLVRSAVYRAATPSQRREVHQALAEATDPKVDPDRRAWHLAEAAGGPDENVATELERAAGRAQKRGGSAAAAAFLERAARLTPEIELRAARALAAAQANLQAGAFAVALTLLDMASMSPLDELQRAHVELLRAQVAFVSSPGSDAPRLLLQAAQRLEPLDIDGARETYLDALSAAMFAGRLARRGGSPLDVSEVALRAPPPLHPARAPDFLLDGLATLYQRGYAAALPSLREALGVFGSNMSAAQELRWLWPFVVCAVHLWDDEAWKRLSERHVNLAREAGALGELSLALIQRIYVHLFAGELTAAASLVQEAQAATEATGSTLAPYGAFGLTALQGREAEMSALIEANQPGVTRRGEGIGISVIEWAKAVLYNGLGRYENAHAAAVESSKHPQELSSPNWAIVELIEAAVRAGTPELAADAHRRLREMAELSGTDWVVGIEARSRALLTEGQHAEDLYIEAIDRLGRCAVAVDLARARLLYGEWLRRERRRREARQQLRTALEMFTSMGTEAFAGRAERELLATGEHARKRSVETRDDLSPQEGQIARLATEGLSNAEIGARLFISSCTVAYHMRNIFSKLNVASRHQLAQALPGGARTM